MRRTAIPRRRNAINASLFSTIERNTRSPLSIVRDFLNDLSRTENGRAFFEKIKKFLTDYIDTKPVPSRVPQSHLLHLSHFSNDQRSDPNVYKCTYRLYDPSNTLSYISTRVKACRSKAPCFPHDPVGQKPKKKRKRNRKKNFSKMRVGKRSKAANYSTQPLSFYPARAGAGKLPETRRESET